MQEFFAEQWRTVAGLVGGAIAFLAGNKMRKGDALINMQKAYDQYTKHINAQMKAFKDDISRIKNENIKLREKNSENKKLIADIKKNNRHINNRLKGLKHENNSLKSKIEMLQIKLIECQKLTRKK